MPQQISNELVINPQLSGIKKGDLIYAVED